MVELVKIACIILSVNVSDLTISRQEEDITPDEINFPALVSKIRKLKPQITDHE